jgi:hypothetical protein
VADNQESREKLVHELRNVEQEKRALQHLLKRATDEIDSLVESNCEEAAKEQASHMAERLRRATEL